jgi:polyhydroxyalkanoate synthesis regulator phasin
MKKLNISENTSVGLPLKNLLSLIAAIVVGSYFAFGVLERLNNLETADILFKEDLLKRAEQEPKNLEMFMLIEHLAGQIEDIEEELKLGRYNKVNIDHLKEQVNVLQEQIDKLRNGGH